MGKDCHRCGSALGSPETFCPNCGAPQLRYVADTEDAEGTEEASGSGRREIQWKPALGAVITFAVPVGLLCSPIVPFVSSGCCLWVVAGSVAAIGLYQRRSATLTVGRRIGLRIGILIGILAATVATACNAGLMVFTRYALHGGTAMEKAFQLSMEQGSTYAAQFSHASPAQADEIMRFWLSPDGRAAATLLMALMSAAGIIVFSAIGGALGTRIFSGRNTSLRNS
jgi:hypothetical protein